MSPTRPFPELGCPVSPVPRPEPQLWVRCLVLVTEQAPEPRLIRDPIELRSGLNIVKVAPRPIGETRRIGNSVGKTLLTRLIRYSLGESHFGTQSTTRTVHGLLPVAGVLAEVRVGGESWVTCRPLFDALIGQSFAVQADDWRAALAVDAARVPFTSFLSAVETAVIGPMPDSQLPGEGRHPRWLDVLGWLARDQECRFQHPSEWRAPDARSGTGRLDRTDASQLSSWVMGLLDSAEIREQRWRTNWAA